MKKFEHYLSLVKTGKINEDFHGGSHAAEIIQDGDRVIANWTGVPVRKNINQNWAVFAKPGDKIFAIEDSRDGFTAANLIYMTVIGLDNPNKLVICDNNGFETPCIFVMADAGNKGHNDDKIAYFKVAQ